MGEVVGDVRETERLSGQRGTSIFVWDRYKTPDGGRWTIASRMPGKHAPSEIYHKYVLIKWFVIRTHTGRWLGHSILMQ